MQPRFLCAAFLISLSVSFSSFLVPRCSMSSTTLPTATCSEGTLAKGLYQVFGSQVKVFLLVPRNWVLPEHVEVFLDPSIFVLTTICRHPCQLQELLIQQQTVVLEINVFTEPICVVVCHYQPYKQYAEPMAKVHVNQSGGANCVHSLRLACTRRTAAATYCGL